MNSASTPCHDSFDTRDAGSTIRTGATNALHAANTATTIFCELAKFFFTYGMARANQHRPLLGSLVNNKKVPFRFQAKNENHSQ
jgi:hypothetical protein